MRIALMTNNYIPFIGGVPISVERLKKGLENAGHFVTVFAPTYEGQVEEENVVRYRTCPQRGPNGMIIPDASDSKIEEAFRCHSYDIIHVHHPMLIGRTAIRLSQKYNVPLVFTYHTRYEQYLKNIKPFRFLEEGAAQATHTKKYASCNARMKAKLLNIIENRITPAYLKGFLKHCNFIFTPTESIQEYLHHTCQIPFEKMDILPTGLLGDSFVTDEQSIKEIRKKYHAEEIPLMVSVSRMSHEKNIEFLLAVVARAKALCQRPFRLLMIGDGPEKPAFEEECRKLGIEKEVVFAGTVPNSEIASYFAAADIFPFASKTETQGIVLLEAFAQATPVFAIEATGVSDLVKDGYNGRICGENVEDFARNLADYMSDRESLSALSQGALKTAFDFREEAVAGKAVHLYNKIIAEYKRERYAVQSRKLFQKILTAK